jgi:SAM-dependent methyltransferase
MIEFVGPNAEQIRYWNEIGGPRYVTLRHIVSEHVRPLGLLALERAAIPERSRVLDVGCGFGETTLEIGRRVGAGGAVLGVDVSAPMIELARESARAADLTNVAFENVDAQTASFEGRPYDALFSRFGVMFFADPAAAFDNLRRALRPGARLAFLCWRSLKENPWLLVPTMAAAPLLPMRRPDPHAPGSFAFADAARVKGLLERAGFVRIEHEAVDQELCLAAGRPLDESVDYLLQLGPAAAALREASPSPELVGRVTDAMRAAVAPYHGTAGVRMAGAAWIVTAEAA